MLSGFAPIVLLLIYSAEAHAEVVPGGAPGECQSAILALVNDNKIDFCIQKSANPSKCMQQLRVLGPAGSVSHDAAAILSQTAKDRDWAERACKQ
jgi:hypothetical protein